MVIVSAVFLAMAFVLGVGLYKAEQSGQAERATVQNREALTRFHAPSLGNASAPVHIVEFLDPACESCRAFYPLVKEIMAAHPDTVRLTIRYAPFHTGASEVVKVIEAARKQGKYWQTLEALLGAQSQWVRDHVAQLHLVWPHLDGLGLDIERLKADMQSPELAKLIQQDIADAKALNVRGTPEFFVNGKPLPAFGEEQLRTLVAAELARATAKQ